MKKNSNIKIWVHSVAITTTITSLVLAIIIVGAEECLIFKDWLKVTFFHHWIGKSVLILGLFVITGFLLLFKREVSRLASIILIESIVVIFSVLVIAGYFLMHILKIV